MAAEAQPLKLRFSGLFPPGSFLTEGYEKFARIMKERTNGEVEIRVFPSSQLGSYENVFQEVIRGTVDMEGNYATPRFNKKFDIQTLPFIVKDFKELNALLEPESPFAKFFAMAYEECGVVYIGSVIDGIQGAAISKGKTVTTPFTTDTKKMTVRVEATPPKREWYMAMGYQVATLPRTEVFSSMQTNVINGNTGDSPEAVFLELRDAVGSYITYDCVFALNDYVISKKAWEALGEKNQKIMREAFAEVAKWTNAEAERSHNQYIAEMKEFGIEVIEPTQNEREFMAKLARDTIWPKYSDTFSKELMDSIVAYITK